jgi:hypothetical protein
MWKGENFGATRFLQSAVSARSGFLKRKKGESR